MNRKLRRYRVNYQKKKYNTEPWGFEITYMMYPKYYTWNSPTKKWQRRKKKVKNVTRMYKAHPSQGPRYYLRLCLLHQIGCKKYDDIRTVVDDNQVAVTYETFREACEAMGLLKDDEEWKICLQEASESSAPNLVYNLFLTILTQCQPDNPARLWEEFKNEICERFFKKKGYSNITATEEEVDECTEMGLCQIKKDLALLTPERSNLHYGLPEPENYEFHGIPRVILREQNYDQEEQKRIVQVDRAKLNHGQKKVFETLLKRIYNPNRSDGYLAFIDAPGGTGKTFVLNTLMSHIRGEGDIALASAFCGVAALLLEGGCTVHKRFDVKPNMQKCDMFTIKKGTALAELMKMTKVIVIDEAPMMNRDILEKIDATLRDILEEPDKQFGGLAVILAGDFRQILPVVKHLRNNRAVVQHTLKKSHLWENVESFELTENMRVFLKKGDPAFAEFILKVGNQLTEDSLENEDIKKYEDEEYIKLPSSMTSGANDLDGFIQEMFPNIKQGLRKRDVDEGRMDMISVLTPKNVDMHHINEKCIQQMPGTVWTRRSHDSASLDNDDLNEYKIPVETLNQLPTPSGMPPHLLHLKKYCPLVILKNLNVNEGLCNGTRCILLEVKRNLLRVKLLHNDTEAFIPRIKVSDNEKYGFTLHRFQFPVQLAFAMSINKAQVPYSANTNHISNCFLF